MKIFKHLNNSITSNNKCYKSLLYNTNYININQYNKFSSNNNNNNSKFTINKNFYNNFTTKINSNNDNIKKTINNIDKEIDKTTKIANEKINEILTKKESIQNDITDNNKTAGFCSTPINKQEEEEAITNNDTKTTNINSISTSNRKKLIKDIQELTKVKLSLLNSIVSLSTYLFYIPITTPINLISVYELVCFSLGTMSISMTTQVLNQVKEKLYDADMKRTYNRPMPKQRLTNKQALLIGSGLYLSSIVLYMQLPYALNTILLSNLILLLYIGVYTPLKRKNNLSMHVGGLVGALPALLGSVAIINAMPIDSLLLAGYILGWQYPHFYGILYPNRDDYINAGFKFIAVDKTKDHIAYYQMIASMFFMLGCVYGLYKNNILGNLAMGGFVISFIYQFDGVMKFMENPVKNGKVIRMRSYIPFLIVLGCFIYRAVEKRVIKAYEEYKSKNNKENTIKEISN